MELYGTRTTRGLRRVISSQNDDLGLVLDFSWEMKNNSDHYTFYRKQIPGLLFHSGLHGDYHRPSDDVERINHEGLRQIARLMFRVTDELANGPPLGGFRQRVQSESQFTQREAEQPLSLASRAARHTLEPQIRTRRRSRGDGGRTR